MEENPKHAHGTINLKQQTSSAKKIVTSCDGALRQDHGQRASDKKNVSGSQQSGSGGK